MTERAVDDDPPVPDPTVLTTAQLLRVTKSERDYVDGQIGQILERLRGIDRATEVLNETINRVPTETQTAVGRLQDLMDERFSSIQTQFAERDTRQERESRDNKVAVDAAFAAQKEAAAKQEETFSKSIDKSEAATAETISKLQDLTTTQDKSLGDKIDAQTKALSDKIDDIKTRLTAAESLKQGGHDTLTGIYSMAAFIGSVLFIIGVLAAAGVFHK